MLTSRFPLRALRIWVVFVALLAAVLVPAGQGRAVVPKVDLTIQKYELANGLEVILERDPKLSTVSTNIWYHVGAANEAAGRTGFAHLFEHMMFQGSGHVPEGKLEALVDATGGYLNATTDFDRTNYFLANLPSNQLELALWLESDRMGFLLDRLSAASLENQKAVVRSERRENSEQRPYSLSDEEVLHQLFPPGHPYRAAIIGSHADIQAASLEDVREFFRTYYVPNNATLAVVGNFDVARTKNLIQKYFGTLKGGPEPPDPAITIPKITAEKRVTLTDQVDLPRVSMAWLTPPRFAAGNAEGDVAAQILAGGESSRLYSKLVRERKIAQSVSAYQDSQKYPSMFFLEATAKPGHTADELEDAINAELAAQASAGPSAADLRGAKNGVISDLIRSLEDVGGYGGRADHYNAYNHYLGTPVYLNKDIARYDAVSAADVRTFVTESLRTSGRVVVTTVPGKRKLPPDPAAPADVPATTKPKASAEAWRLKVPGVGPKVAVALPKVQRFALGNGMPVYLVKSSGLPLVTASVVSRYGSAMDPDGLPGLASFSASMLRQGTKNRSATEVAAHVAGFGGLLDSDAAVDGSTLTVQSLVTEAPRALALAANLVRRPAFRKADIARVRDDLEVDFGQAATDPGTTAWRLLAPAVYGPDHPYGHLAPGTRRGVGKVTRADLKRFHAAAFNPSNAALVLAGDLTRKQAKTLATKAFGTWKGTGPPAVVPGAGSPRPERVVIVDSPGAAQTSLEIGQPGLARTNPDFERMEVANRVLGGLGLSNRLMLNLREKNGYSYGVYADLGVGRGAAIYDAYGAVTTAATGPAVREILREMRRVRTTLMTPEEVRRGKESFVGSVPSLFQATPDAVGTAARMYLFDLPLNYYKTLPARVKPFTAAELRDVMAKYLKPSTMKIVAVGDRSKIAPQLRKLKLGKIAHRKPSGALVKPKAP